MKFCGKKRNQTLLWKKNRKAIHGKSCSRIENKPSIEDLYKNRRDLNIEAKDLPAVSLEKELRYTLENQARVI
jgi:hypothetical protein